jgi:hypothetical protein
VGVGVGGVGEGGDGVGGGTGVGGGVTMPMWRVNVYGQRVEKDLDVTPLRVVLTKVLLGPMHWTVMSAVCPADNNPMCTAAA